jgi:hypothetical protein
MLKALRAPWVDVNVTSIRVGREPKIPETKCSLCEINPNFGGNRDERFVEDWRRVL